MKRGDIVATILERKIIRARIFDWNGNLQSHVKLVDGNRNPYKVYPWQCYGAGQFTRDGRVLMTQEQAAETQAATAFLDAKHERAEFAETFNARPTAKGKPGRRMVAVPPREGFINAKDEHVLPASTRGGANDFDIPMTMVSRGLGREEDGTRYHPQTGLTMSRQLERYIEWYADFEPQEQHALELLEARSIRQAEVWKRCVKGNWHGLTEKQVTLAKEWGVTPQAVNDLKKKALKFMLDYLPEDPRPYYASYDPEKVA